MHVGLCGMVSLLTCFLERLLRLPSGPTSSNQLEPTPTTVPPSVSVPVPAVVAAVLERDMEVATTAAAAVVLAAAAPSTAAITLLSVPTTLLLEATDRRASSVLTAGLYRR